jgi:small subunit ribosomal protein S20
MAHRLSAKKDIRRRKKRTLQNKSLKSAARTQVKKVIQAVSSGNYESAVKELSLAYKGLDKAAKIHAFHSNKSARLKSRLAKKVAALKPATAAK